jgi:hypothetical protein
MSIEYKIASEGPRLMGNHCSCLANHEQLLFLHGVDDWISNEDSIQCEWVYLLLL